MFTKMIRSTVGFGFLLVLSVSAFAQQRTSAVSDYLISANAGGVNYIEGSVAKGRSDTTRQRIGRGDSIEVHERVSTDTDGRAEVLLNPGSFLRVGGNTEFEFRSTDLENVIVMLKRGSAMVELLATRDFKATFVTPKGRVVLVETGIYRINVADNGEAELFVWEGLAEVGSSRVQVKKNRGVTFGATISPVEKFDRDDEKDALAVWSKERGKLVARSTAKLKDKALRDSLINGFNAGRWGMRDAFGLWVYNRRLGYSCFLPFGAGWYSPYGFGFGNSIWWYNLPTIIYYQPPVPDIYGTKRRPNTAASEQGPGFGGGAPPYVKLDNSIRQSSPIRSGYDPTTDRGGSYTPSAPVYIPPPPPPPSDTGAKTRP
ncbi:MAG TPA: FecR family protein [Pyrinomonadaceae bacterium]|nr:FecR family protein [Pyrinomonadaceae bacterium]